MRISEKTQKIAQSEDYWYQELEDAFARFMKYKISKNKLDELINKVDSFYKRTKVKNKFPFFIEKNEEYQEFLKIIGTVISMCDANAANKKEYNPYPDTRVLAKANVRQKDWIINLLRYKIDKNTEMPPSIDQAIAFIEKPEENTTYLSIRYRKLISSNLLGSTYSPTTYYPGLVRYFRDPIKQLNIKNKKNTGVVIAGLIYSNEEKWNIPKEPENNSPNNSSKNRDKIVPENSNQQMKIDRRPNHILYGPPGTGKTYKTINMALEIIEGKSVNEDRNTLKARFDEYIKNGQIVFTTFHQSYSYEEFIEGIRPCLSSSESENIHYKIEDGIFKGICKVAQSKTIKSESTTNFDISKNTIWKFSLGNSANGEDQYYFEEALRTSSLVIGYGGRFDLNKYPDLNQTIKIPNEISQLNAFKNEMQIGDLVIISDGNLKFKAIAEITSEYYFDKDSDLPQKRKIKWIRQFDISRSYKDISERPFTQRTINKPQHIDLEKLNKLIAGNTEENDLKNYVIIIDEINRGNISKIFGELITLIEPSKRLGADEATIVTLPYSKDEFGVPSNLYIIGTMNTADRSIALMDTALRRRFEFVEMMPNPELLGSVSTDGKEIDLKVLLSVINQRIEFLYDRDHQIGHSYLMNIENINQLDSAFRNKIIPLLQEYFYDDWEKIQLVLGDHENQFSSLYIDMDINKTKDYFIQANNLEDKKVLGFNYDDNQDKTTSYHINPNQFTSKSYLKLTASHKEKTVTPEKTNSYSDTDVEQ